MLNLNQIYSWLPALGKQLLPCTLAARKFVSLFLFGLLAFNGVTHAQFSCPDPARCTSKDLEVQSATLITSRCFCNSENTTPITGTLTMSVINKTGSERTSFAFFGTLVKTNPDGTTTSQPISGCGGPIDPNSTKTLTFGNITFTCGQSLKITNVFLAWTSAADAHNSCADILAANCSSIAPKCGTVAEIIVNTPLAVTKTAETLPCIGSNTGSLTFKATGGAGGYSYTLSGGTLSSPVTNSTGVFTGLGAGTYTVSVTDSKNCTVPLTVTLGSQAKPDKPTVTVTQPTCTVATGSIKVTSTITNLKFSINSTNPADFTNTTGVFSNLNPGDYCIRAISAGGCISDPVCVTINKQPATPAKPTLDVTQPTCTTGTGIIKVTSTITGLKFSINSTNPADFTNTTGVFSNLAPGNYCIRAMNTDGCISDAACTTINAAPKTPDAPTVSVTQPTCTVATGCIKVTSTITGLKFSINSTTPADFTNTTGEFCNLAPGNYCIRAMNSDGCISAPTCKTINAQPVTPTCTLTAPATLPTCGSTGNTLTATTSVTGATYLWTVTGTGWVITGGQGTGTITYTAGSNGTLGVFTLKVTKDGCSSTCTVTFGCKANIVQGCTPGFWKNTRTRWDQASDAVPTCITAAIKVTRPTYSGTATTSSLFKDVFGLTSQQMLDVGLNPNMSLLDALNLGGGNCYKLARHAVAALLSSCGLKYYTYTTAQVLKMTHDAIASKTCEPTASKLAAANEAGSCPLSSDGNNDMITANQLAKPGEAIEDVTKLSVSATPNPYYTRIRFEIKSPVSGNGTLELYNLIGQRLNIVFQGHVDAGKTKTVEYSVPSPLRTDLIYRMSVGTQSTTGKLIQGQR